MANILNVQHQQAIITLAALGRSIRQIAKEFGIHRKTVRQYLPAPPGDPKCTTISTSGSGAKCTIPTAGKKGRKSLCQSVASLIEEKLLLGLTAQRIFQDLKTEIEFTGSYQSVKRFARSLRKAAPKRIWRIETSPAEETQVDFGLGAPLLLQDGRKQRTWVFRMVLSYSRKAYSEAVLRQDTETFIRLLENGFRHFGGATRTINLDNLKAAVLKFDFADPDLNPKLAAFANHYAVAILPCLPRTPEHKGKVENSVGYVKENALAARTFQSLGAENQFLADWEKTVADLRIHGTTKRQVLQLFAEEKKHLLPLPNSLFPFFSEAMRSVNRDAYVEVAKSYYAAPPEYIGQKIWVRWDQREVRLFNTRLEQIQIHRRLQPGQFSKVLGIGGGQGTLQANLDYWVRRVSDHGGDCAAWAKALVQKRGVEAMRSLMGFVRLPDQYPLSVLNRACARAVSANALRLRDIRALLESTQTQTHFQFAQQHPLIRDLSEYGVFIKTQIHE